MEEHIETQGTIVVPETPGFLRTLKTCLGPKYFCFKGRASRSEYWFFHLGALIINFVVSFVSAFAIDNFRIGYEGTLIAVILVGLCLFLPSLAVGVRLFHDVGLSGGLLVLLRFFAVASFWASCYGHWHSFRVDRCNIIDSRSLMPIDPVDHIYYEPPAWLGVAIVATIISILCELVVALRKGQRGPNEYDYVPVKQPNQDDSIDHVDFWGNLTITVGLFFPLWEYSFY